MAGALTAGAAGALADDVARFAGAGDALWALPAGAAAGVFSGSFAARSITLALRAAPLEDDGEPPLTVSSSNTPAGVGVDVPEAAARAGCAVAPAEGAGGAVGTPPAGSATADLAGAGGVDSGVGMGVGMGWPTIAAGAPEPWACGCPKPVTGVAAAVSEGCAAGRSSASPGLWIGNGEPWYAPS